MAFKMKNPSMAKLTKAAGDNRVAMKMKKDSAMKKEGESPKLKRAVKTSRKLAKKADSVEKKSTMGVSRKNLKSSKGGGKMTQYTKNPAYAEYERKRKSHRDRGGDDASFNMTPPPKYIKVSERKIGDKESPSKMKKSAMKMKEPMKMKKDSAAKFNAKLKAASKAGKLSGKFKEAVDAAPAKMKKPMKMKKAAMKMNYKK